MVFERLMAGHPGDGALGLTPAQVEHFGSERGQHERDRVGAWDRDLKIGAVFFALVPYCLAAQYRFQNTQIVAHMRHMARIRQAEHTLDHHLVGQSDAQRKTALTRRLGGQCSLTHHHGVARIGRYDRRSQFNT